MIIVQYILHYMIFIDIKHIIIVYICIQFFSLKKARFSVQLQEYTLSKYVFYCIIHIITEYMYMYISSFFQFKEVEVFSSAAGIHSVEVHWAAPLTNSR